MGDWARARLPFALAEFIMFVLKQGWACLFGGLLLLAIIATKLVWQPDWPIHRYDALFLFAIGTQALFLWKKLETWEEARVILLFHLTGTAMEWFKVTAGSWAYPEPGVFVIMNVPLFSGFMYAAVGSYIVRVIRIFDMRFAPYPPYWQTYVLAAAIYINFFAHHFLPDIRLALFVATVVIFGRTRVWFRIHDRDWWMPMPLAGVSGQRLRCGWPKMSAPPPAPGSIPGKAREHWVSFAKLGSWYLLLVCGLCDRLAGQPRQRSIPRAAPVQTRPRQ